MGSGLYSILGADDEGLSGWTVRHRWIARRVYAYIRNEGTVRRKRDPAILPRRSTGEYLEASPPVGHRRLRLQTLDPSTWREPQKRFLHQRSGGNRQDNHRILRRRTVQAARRLRRDVLLLTI